MKHQGFVAVILVLVVACNAAASTVARSARALRGQSTLGEAEEAETLSGQAFMDLSESTAEDRNGLLSRLGRAEALTGSERQALKAQQRVLMALAKDQETLESRIRKLEANERAELSGGVVEEKGTVSNSVGQTPIFPPRQEKTGHAPDYKVASRGAKSLKAESTSMSSKSEDSGLVILMHESEKQLWANYNAAFWEKMIMIACYLGQIFVFAFLYLQFCKHSAAPKLPESQVRTEEFQFGAFDASDLLRDCQMCACALCCPWIRWADTASQQHIQFLAFLPGLFITALLSAAGTVTFGFSMPILLIIVVLCRQRIRDAYGLPSGSWTILCGDCLMWACCPCCAIVQEARQVEYVEVPMQEYGIAP